MNLLFRFRRRKSVFVGVALLFLFALAALVLDHASDVVISEDIDEKVEMLYFVMSKYLICTVDKCNILLQIRQLIYILLAKQKHTTVGPINHIHNAIGQLYISRIGQELQLVMTFPSRPILSAMQAR